MPRITLTAALAVFLITPAVAQQAEIDAVNAKWIDFFNKGDFAGVRQVTIIFRVEDSSGAG